MFTIKNLIKSRVFGFIDQEVAEALTALDVGKIIDERKNSLVKEYIQSYLKLPLDDRDPQWNRFLVRYCLIKQKVSGYDRSFGSIVVILFLLEHVWKVKYLDIYIILGAKIYDIVPQK